MPRTPAPPTGSRPLSLRVAVWWWGTAAVLVAGLAAAAWAGSGPLDTGSPATAVLLALSLSALALVLGWGTLRLGLGHLAGRLTLTAFGLIAGLPLLFKGPRLLLPALVLLVGTALLYLPGARAFFRAQVTARRRAGRPGGAGRRGRTPRS